MNTITAYKDPVAQLLEIGEIKFGDPWSDYREYGISSADIPDLIAMATDMDLNQGDPDSRETWAPVHAWRALGQLRAVEAVNPLINLFHELSNDDWLYEEMPGVFEAIGPTALPALAVYLRFPYRPEISRGLAAECIAQIGQKYPEEKESCIRILMDQLRFYPENGPELNGYLIGHLVDLGARQAFSLIKQAFESGNVDRTYISLDYVRNELEI